MRQTATQSVPIKNTTIKPWTLKPTIQNDFWTGAEFLDVPAGPYSSPPPFSSTYAVIITETIPNSSLKETLRLSGEMDFGRAEMWTSVRL